MIMNWMMSMKQTIIVNKYLKLRDAIDEDIYDYIKIPFNKELLKMYDLKCIQIRKSL